MAKKMLKLPQDVPLYRIFNDDTRVLGACQIVAEKGEVLIFDDKLQEAYLGLYARLVYRVENRECSVFYILPEDIVPQARTEAEEWVEMRHRRGDSPHPSYIRNPIDGYMAEVEKEIGDLIAPHVRAFLQVAS